MDSFVKRLVTVLVALVLLIYVGFQAYQIINTTIEVETVNSYKVYDTVDVEGITIRNETVISQKVDGYIFYTTADGGRVAKDGTIAQIYPTENDALMQQQLDLLDREIADLKAINDQGTSNRANLSSINKQLNETWLSLIRASQESSYTQLQDIQTRLLSLLNKQQITIGKVDDFTDQLAALNQERESLAGSFTSSTAQISSPVAGYFVSRADGYESVLTVDHVLDLSPEEIENAMNAAPAIPENSVGKVVGDYEWYMACVVPVEQAAEMKQGAQLTLRLPFVTNQTIPVEVMATNRNKEGKVAVIFKCANMSQELSSIRREQVQIQIKEYSGLRVPDSALQFNDQQETGVYVRVGNALTFKKVKVLYHSENDRYSICEITDEDGYLQLYDSIVVGGKNLYDGKIIR